MSDPVTGTKVGLSNTGISSTENYEPLGQQIDAWDMTEPPEPPPTYEPPIGSATEPEWQCGAGKVFCGGFSGMPFHCQKKAGLYLHTEFNLKIFFANESRN